MVGYIYVFWNPCLKDMVKIGYSNNVRNRLSSANATTELPQAFRVYCTYEVERELADKILHTLIDIINPDLHIKEVIDGKERIREFFKLNKHKAYLMLESIAVVSGTEHKLKRYKDVDDIVINDISRDTVFGDVIDKTNLQGYENSLFDECVPNVKEFAVEGNVVEKAENYSTVEDSIYFGNEIIEVDQNTESEIYDKEASYKFSYEEKEMERELIWKNFKKKMLALSSNVNDFDKAVNEWYLKAIKIRNTPMLSCNCCGKNAKLLFCLCNKENGNNFYVSDECLEKSLFGGNFELFNIVWFKNCYCLSQHSLFDKIDEFNRNGLAYFDKVKRFSDTNYMLFYYFNILSEKEVMKYLALDISRKEHDVYVLNEKECSLLENAEHELLIVNKIVPFFQRLSDSCDLILNYPDNTNKDVYLFDSLVFLESRIKSAKTINASVKKQWEEERNKKIFKDFGYMDFIYNKYKLIEEHCDKAVNAW